MNYDKRPTKKLVPCTWTYVHVGDQQAVVDRLASGPHGIGERLNASAEAIELGDRLVAERCLRQAATLLAIVRQLGWDVEGVDGVIKAQASLLGCEVA